MSASRRSSWTRAGQHAAHCDRAPACPWSDFPPGGRTGRYKDFAVGHVCRAFCVGVIKNDFGRTVLEDTSTRDNNDPHDIKKKRERLNSQRGKWGPATWMGRDVFLYGASAIPESHEIVEFLQRDESTLPKRIRLLGTSFKEFSALYPGLCTSVSRPRAAHRYPAEIVPGQLYLGDWQHAEDSDALDHLNIMAVLTIHQRPHDLRVSRQRTQLCITQDDTDTEAILPHISTAIDFIDKAKAKGVATLVHCGAGISRSATLVIGYLMTHNNWTLNTALTHCTNARPVARPNGGFMKALGTLERNLGLASANPVVETEGAGASNAVPGIDSSSHVSGAGGFSGGGGQGGEVLKSARLIVKKDGEMISKVGLPAGKKVTVGRNDQADFKVEHPSISRIHLKLFFDGKDIIAEDNGSAHGTKHNGKALKANDKVILRDGDVLQLGASTRTYHVSLTDATGGAKRKAEAPAPAHAASESGKRSKADQVEAAHVLLKHSGSRKLQSWKDPLGEEIKLRSIEAARARLEQLRQELLSTDDKEEKMAFLAQRYSDCSSAKVTHSLTLSLTDSLIHSLTHSPSLSLSLLSFSFMSLSSLSLSPSFLSLSLARARTPPPLSLPLPPLPPLPLLPSLSLSPPLPSLLYPILVPPPFPFQ